MRKLFLAASALALLAVAAVIGTGRALVAPAQRVIDDLPRKLPVEPVSVTANDGTSVAGWFVPGQPRRGGILLLHAIRSDRRQMIRRARFLHAAGYSILLIDLRGHGETPGRRITFGYRESEDAHAAASYLRRRVHGGPVGVIGVSMGGAAALLGCDPIEADALVLEAVYSSIDRAAENRLRLRFGKLGVRLAPLLLWQIEPLLGISRTDLSPARAIAFLNSPVLVAGGTEDRRTRPEETKRLFSQAAAPKRLWLLEGAKHEDLHRFAPAEYERRILEFFDTHLGGDTS